MRAGEQVRRDGSRRFEWTAMRALLESVACEGDRSRCWPTCKLGERKGDRRGVGLARWCWTSLKKKRKKVVGLFGPRMEAG